MRNFKENIKNIIILILVLAIAFWGYLEYKRYKYNDVKMAPTVVASSIEVLAPKLQDITASYDYIGQVTAINQVDIVPYISGYISQILKSGGNFVKKNDVILTIRQDEYISQLEAAQASVYSAVADYENAEIQYNRLKKAGSKAISQSEIDKARATYLMSKAALKKAYANFTQSQINYEYTYLTAPFDGILGNINASVGDFISPASTKIVRLVQYNPIRVVFSVTDKEFLSSKNQKITDVKLKVSDGSIYSGKGKIKYTANEINPTTNSIAIYAEFENPNRELIPNAYVKVILENIYLNSILIAKDKIVFKQDGNYIYVVRKGILKLKKINILAQKGNDYIIKNNFEKEEFIVKGAVEEDLLEQKVDIVKYEEEE